MHARRTANQPVERTRTRSWEFPSIIIANYLNVTLIAWAILLVIVMCIAAGLDAFGQLNGSTWDDATQVPAWYAGGIAGFVAWQTVPMLVANGRTRRDAGIVAGLFAVTMSLVITALVVIGFLIEKAVYSLANWPETIDKARHFTTHTDFGPMVVEYALLYSGWSAVGLMVGLALYRYGHWGAWMYLVLASILIGILGLFTYGPSGMFLDQFYSLPNETLLNALLATLACILIALGFAWRMLRAMPIHNR